MSPAELLAKAESLGARLSIPKTGRLLIEAPEPLPEDLMAELRQHKAELLLLLAICRCTPPMSPADIYKQDCQRCRQSCWCPTCGGCRWCGFRDRYPENA